jgi:hypothetical protein
MNGCGDGWFGFGLDDDTLQITLGDIELASDFSLVIIGIKFRTLRPGRPRYVLFIKRSAGAHSRYYHKLSSSRLDLQPATLPL